MANKFVEHHSVLGPIAAEILIKNVVKLNKAQISEGSQSRKFRS